MPQDIYANGPNDDVGQLQLLTSPLAATDEVLNLAPDRSLFFMLDNVFCSSMCRLSFAAADSVDVTPGK